MGGNQSTPENPSSAPAAAPSVPSTSHVNHPSLEASSAPIDPGITVVNAGKARSKPLHSGDGNVETSRALRATMHITLPMLLHSQVDIADVIDAGRILLVGGKAARLNLSSLEHSAQNIQSCLAAAAASIATDQNQLIAAVCSARTHVQTAAKKLQDAKTACAKIAVSAAAAPGINICDCASAARGQRDELLSLVGQLQELAEFVTAAAAHDSRCLDVPSFPFMSVTVASQLSLKPKAATFCSSSAFDGSLHCAVLSPFEQLPSARDA